MTYYRQLRRTLGKMEIISASGAGHGKICLADRCVGREGRVRAGHTDFRDPGRRGPRGSEFTVWCRLPSPSALAKLVSGRSVRLAAVFWNSLGVIASFGLSRIIGRFFLVFLQPTGSRSR